MTYLLRFFSKTLRTDIGETPKPSIEIFSDSCVKNVDFQLEESASSNPVHTIKYSYERLKRLMGTEDSLFGDVSSSQVVQIAAAELLGTVMIVIQVIGHISKAHLNPAVTCCLVVIGDINVPLAGVYIVSELIGATLGYGVLLSITPSRILNQTAPEGSCCAFCVNLVNKELTPLQGLLAEFLVTSILILVVCSVFDKRNAHNSDSVPIKFGLTIAAIAMAEAPFTGASMNPARSFGPAVWTGVWENHWV
ncbi:hypothetical protein L9F63_001427, partial [Diploptera punctata]